MEAVAIKTLLQQVLVKKNMSVHRCAGETDLRSSAAAVQLEAHCQTGDRGQEQGQNREDRPWAPSLADYRGRCNSWAVWMPSRMMMQIFHLLGK